MIRAALALGLIASTALVPAAQAQRWEAQSRIGANRAYQECLDNQRDRQLAGAVIGGVLGAVIASELADDDDDDHRHEYRRGRADPYWGGRRYDRRDWRRDRRYDRRYDRWDRRYDRRYDRWDRRHGYRSDLDGDDVAVVAGLGLGAVAGAAVAGGGDCDHLLQRGQNPDHRRIDDRGYGYDYSAGAGGVFGEDDDWDRGLDDGWDEPLGEDYRDWEYSNDRLAGAPSDARIQQAPPLDRDAPRVFQARSQNTGPTGLCRYMSAGANRQTLMCQGADGVWRPAD